MKSINSLKRQSNISHREMLFGNHWDAEPEYLHLLDFPEISQPFSLNIFCPSKTPIWMLDFSIVYFS